MNYAAKKWINIKDTNRESAHSNETLSLTININLAIWVVVTSNQLFLRGS